MTKHYARNYRFRRPQQGLSLRSEEELALENQQRYEEAVVKLLLKSIGKWDLRRKLWYRQKNQFDFGRLAFHDFQQETNFPMWLGTRRMDLNKHLSLVNLLRNFYQTPIFSAFLELQHAVPAHAAEFPVGLVFPVPHIKFMVLHNRPSDFRPGATRVVIPLDDGSTLTLEKLDDLLVAVGRPESWTTLQS
jgi:hypothetical protein